MDFNHCLTYKRLRDFSLIKTESQFRLVKIILICGKLKPLTTINVGGSRIHQNLFFLNLISLEFRIVSSNFIGESLLGIEFLLYLLKRERVKVFPDLNRRH